MEGSTEAKYRHGNLSRKLRTHIFYHEHEAERANHKWIKAMILDHILPPTRPYLPGIFKWVPSVEMPERMGLGRHSWTDPTLCIGVMFSSARELLALCKERLAPFHLIQLSVC